MKWNNTFFRFLLVGILNTLVGLSATYLLLNGLKLSYYPSTFLGNATGAVVSFFLNKTFTFQSKSSIWWSALKFTVVILVCYGLSYYWGLHLTKWLLSHVTTNTKWVENGAVLVGALLYTITNYLGQKFFTFRTSATLEQER